MTHMLMGIVTLRAFSLGTLGIRSVIGNGPKNPLVVQYRPFTWASAGDGRARTTASRAATMPSFFMARSPLTTANGSLRERRALTARDHSASRRRVSSRAAYPISLAILHAMAADFRAPRPVDAAGGLPQPFCMYAGGAAPGKKRSEERR